MGSESNFLVRAIGFYNDAYDLFIMNIINVILTKQYGEIIYNSSMKSMVSSCVFYGSVLGQLLFGYYADILGRKRIMVITAALLIIGGLLCTTAYGGRNGSNTILLIAIYRCILGIGIGGEYPLSCTFTAESSSTLNRGKAVSTTFSMQGLGQLSAALFGNLLVQSLANSDNDYKIENLEIIWRLLFGLGTIPAILIFYPRLKSQENKYYIENNIKNNQLNESSLERNDINHSNDSHLHYNYNFLSKLKFIYKYYRWRLFGTSMSWFLFDIVFYSQGVFSATILDSSDFGNTNLQGITLKLVYLALGALPGYYVAIYTIDRIGRKNMQLQGFFFMTLLFLILSIWWNTIRKEIYLFIILYGLTFFFSNFGPNTTTFILPVESFPTSIRATCHGFSAAMGKLGAAIGTSLFSIIESSYGTQWVFGGCAFISFLCIPLTYFLIQDRVGALELLDFELQEFLKKEDETTQDELSDILRDSLMSTEYPHKKLITDGSILNTNFIEAKTPKISNL